MYVYSHLQLLSLLPFLFSVKKGDRIAQLVCERICYPDIVEQQVNCKLININSVHLVATTHQAQPKAGIYLLIISNSFMQIQVLKQSLNIWIQCGNFSLWFCKIVFYCNILFTYKSG